MLSICFLCVSVPKSKLLTVKRDEYGTLRVDAAGIISPIFVGDDATQLSNGAGQYYGSVFPGDIGNTLITGHTNSVQSDQ